MITDINHLDVTKQYSYADYLTWNFKERVELIRGWISKIDIDWPDRHQQVLGNLHAEIGRHFKHKSTQVRPAPYDVRLPKAYNLKRTKTYLKWCSPIYA